jgi:hypothetical protein
MAHHSITSSGRLAIHLPFAPVANRMHNCISLQSTCLTTSTVSSLLSQKRCCLWVARLKTALGCNHLQLQRSWCQRRNFLANSHIKYNLCWRLVDCRVIHGKDGVGNDAEDIITQIERTTQLVDNYESKTSKLNADKARILNEEGSQSEKKRKLKPVFLEMKSNDKMVKQLKFTLKKQRSELAKQNGQDNDG